MSIFRPAGKIFSQFSKIQQLAPISTTADLLANCSKWQNGKMKCDPMKGVGYCTKTAEPRVICDQLEVPECIKEPKPKTRMGKPEPLVSDPKKPCDPGIKPFQSSGQSTISALRCPSQTATSICEPPSSPFSTPFRNYSTNKCEDKKKVKKPCFKSKKVTKKKFGENWDSPVSCEGKGSKKSRCDLAKCGPTFTPCGKPRPINQHKCPKKTKKPRMTTIVVKKRKLNMGYKMCKEPKALTKFSCNPDKVQKKKVAEKPPPTPTRCPCFKPVDLNENKGPICKKMPCAVDPTCKGKPKPDCDKCDK